MGAAACLGRLAMHVAVSTGGSTIAVVYWGVVLQSTEGSVIMVGDVARGVNVAASHCIPSNAKQGLLYFCTRARCPFSVVGDESKAGGADCGLVPPRQQCWSRVCVCDFFLLAFCQIVL